MSNFVNELKVNSIINKEEIEKLKKYINEKYPDNSEKANAVILAKTVHQIIDKNLSEFNDAFKEEIRIEVIKNTFLKESDEILKFHIFEVGVNLVDKTPKFKRELTEWVNANQSNVISEKILDNYIEYKSKNKINEKFKNIPQNDNLYNIEAKGDYYKEPNNSTGIGEDEVSCTLDLVDENNSCDNCIHIGNIIENEHIDYKYNNYFHMLSKIIKVFRLQIGFSKKEIEGYFLKKRTVIITTFFIIASVVIVRNFFIMKNDSNDVSVNNNQIEIKQDSSVDIIERNINEKIEKDKLAYHPHLPEYFNYTDINLDKLLTFLNNKQSLLAEEPYFSTMINTAKEFNLNPLILFAITGQEQGFVPKNQKDAEKIANNPFNVFHSWQEYNTDIKDASRIAARTVINLALGLPENEDPFKWINREYAEDPEWGRGVKTIYHELIEATKH